MNIIIADDDINFLHYMAKNLQRYDFVAPNCDLQQGKEELFDACLTQRGFHFKNGDHQVVVVCINDDLCREIEQQVFDAGFFDNELMGDFAAVPTVWFLQQPHQPRAFLMSSEMRKQRKTIEAELGADTMATMMQSDTGEPRIVEFSKNVSEITRKIVELCGLPVHPVDVLVDQLKNPAGSAGLTAG